MTDEINIETLKAQAEQIQKALMEAGSREPDKRNGIMLEGSHTVLRPHEWVIPDKDADAISWSSNGYAEMCDVEVNISWGTTEEQAVRLLEKMIEAIKAKPKYLKEGGMAAETDRIIEAQRRRADFKVIK